MPSNVVISTISRHLPAALKPLARKIYRRNRHWAHPSMRKYGTVQDLYYWVSDGNLDTLLVLQNYFSSLYPTADTETGGVVTLRSDDGEVIGQRAFSLAHSGAAKFRVSSLLMELGSSPQRPFGTLEVHIDIPQDVLGRIRDQKSMYFWDRFSIGYTTKLGQTCFVHGIDKTHIYRDGQPASVDWYRKPGGHEWAPEIPVDMDDYATFSVVLINRTSRRASVALSLSDSEDRSRSWDAKIPPKGVHRFQLTSEDVTGLSTRELRMRVKGMPTRFGRPVVFKEFPNGAISAMHC